MLYRVKMEMKEYGLKEDPEPLVAKNWGNYQGVQEYDYQVHQDPYQDDEDQVTVLVVGQVSVRDEELQDLYLAYVHWLDPLGREDQGIWQDAAQVICDLYGLLGLWEHLDLWREDQEHQVAESWGNYQGDREYDFQVLQDLLRHVHLVLL